MRYALRIHTGYHLAKETWFEAGRAWTDG